MPYRSAHPCSYPGCPELVSKGSRCALHAVAKPVNVQKLYNSKRWKEGRRQQLDDQPWCADCLKAGRYTKATDVHHKDPHMGDEVKFWAGPFESLCHRHHSKYTAYEINGRGGKKVIENSKLNRVFP